MKQFLAGAVVFLVLLGIFFWMPSYFYPNQPDNSQRYNIDAISCRHSGFPFPALEFCGGGIVGLAGRPHLSGWGTLADFSIALAISISFIFLLKNKTRVSSI